MAQSKEPTIEQMNVVIAAFEGRKFYGHPIDKFGGDTGNALPEMKYDASWDWLMPVIKKIRWMHTDVLLTAKCGVGSYIKAASGMNSGLISCDIDKAHIGVYKFITWFNQQPQTNGQNNG